MTASTRTPHSNALLIAGILLIATNLRAPFTSVAPLLETIRDGFGLTTPQAGLIQTLPLLAFAIFSPFVAGFAGRLGMERMLFFALLIIAFGIGLRSYAGLTGLYSGTLIIGLGIAIGNVLLPGILKRSLPHKAAGLTGLYALTMGLAAALGSSVMIPFTQNTHSARPQALLMTLILPAIALVFWIPQLSRHSTRQKVKSTPKAARSASVWRSGLAWQVSLFFGLNSLIYYIVVTWLPAMLESFGFSAAEAGSLHGVLQLATAVPGFLVGPILARLQDQRAPGVLFALVGTAGLVGLLSVPSLATLWVCLIGFSTGACIILGLAFISLRSGDVMQAAALSGMTQGVGYLLAACGPPAVGFMHDRVSGWALPLAACIILSLTLTVLGYMAGRARQLPNLSPGSEQQRRAENSPGIKEQ